jgi:hypothetical protein
VALNNPVRIETPPIKQWSGGLLAVATVLPMPSPHYRQGIIFRSPDCGNVGQFFDTCAPYTGAAKAPTFPNPGTVQGHGPWANYAYMNCRGYGDGSLAAMLPEARASLKLGTPKRVETEFWTDALAVPASVVLNVSSLAADAFTVAGGIAALEQYMRFHYAGQATLHMEAGVAVYLAALRDLVVVNGVPQTLLGSQIAFYGGSPNTSPAGVPAPVGYTWIYATSQVTLWYSEIDIYPELDQMLQYGNQINEPTAIAEQVWVGTNFCAQAAVLVHVDANVPLTEA